MGSRALLILSNFKFKSSLSSVASSSKPLFLINNNTKIRNFSTKMRSLQPPDVPRLAETARISLAPNEVREFAPKIRQVIDWFGQLQAVDLDSVEPAIRAAATPVRRASAVSVLPRLISCVPMELEEFIATAYSNIWQEEAKSNIPHSYATVRTLLSVLQISAALARLRFSETVAQSDLDEALRLMQMSKFSLYSDDRQKSGLDTIS